MRHFQRVQIAFVLANLLAWVSWATPAAFAQAQPGDEEALTALGMGEGATGTWAERRLEGRSYIFTDYRAASDAGELTAEALIIENPRMSESGPMLDAIRLERAVTTDGSGQGSFSYDRFEVEGPNATTAIAMPVFVQNKSLSSVDVDFATLGFERFTIDGFTLNPGADDFSMTAERLVVTDLADLVAGSVEFIQVEMTQPPSGTESFEIATFETLRVEGFDFSSGYPFGAGLSALSEDDSSSEFVARFSLWDAMILRNVEMSGGGMDMGFEEFRFETSETEAGRSTRVSLPGAYVASDEMADAIDADAIAITQALGIDEAFTMSLNLNLYHDFETDRLESRGENYLSMAEGRFIMHMDVALVDYQAFEEALSRLLAAQSPTEQQMATMGAMATYKIERFELRMEENGLTDTLLAVAAEQEGRSVEEQRRILREQYREDMAGLGKALPPALASQVQAAVLDWSDQGGTLTIALEPETPMAVFTMLMAMGQGNLEPLGLSVSHQPHSRF